MTRALQEPGVLPVSVVLLVVAIAGLLRLAWALRYKRMSSARRAALAGTELRHYTSRAAGAVVDQGDGTVAVAPREGAWGVVAEVGHLNWWFWTGSGRAVYFYSGVPTDKETRYHGHASEVVVRITGDDLLELHPGRLHYSPRDSAVAVRGGYRGPGVVEPVRGHTTPPPGTMKGRVRGAVRALRDGR